MCAIDNISEIAIRNVVLFPQNLLSTVDNPQLLQINYCVRSYELWIENDKIISSVILMAIMLLEVFALSEINQNSQLKLVNLQTNVELIRTNGNFHRKCYSKSDNFGTVE